MNSFEGRAMRAMAVATLVTVVGVFGCAGGRGNNVITVKGSDTMVILGQRWAEAYMAAHPGTVIQVTGGGSGTGIAALVNGTTDICMASRTMKDEERQSIQRRYGEPPHETLVARDGLTLYLHEENPVHELTLGQLKAIYTGQVTRWNQVGGANLPIIAYGRENSSGTYEYFKEHVLEKADFASAVQALPGTAAVVNAVSKDPRGIGYGGVAYVKGVRVCGVKRDDTSAAVLPTEATVRSGDYPISRGLFFYTHKAPAGAIADFVAFALSDSGQALVTDVGYYKAH